jgi:hypothetical protein
MTLNPNISVIGNHILRLSNVRQDRDRNRPLLGELEIGLQQAIYPGIRFDAFVAGHADEDFAMHIEEAYITATRALGLPVGAILGQKRLNIGKANPLHPHAWLYADTPAPIAYFLGGEGALGNGIAANYTLPNTGRLFVNLEVGVWSAVTHEEHDEEEGGGKALLSKAVQTFNRAARSSRGIVGEPPAEPGLGVVNMLPLARLWTSTALGTGGELEVGTSHGYGKAENGDNIRLAAADLTLRRFPGAFSRYILQTEWFQHRRTDGFGGTGSHARDGYYVHLGYRPSQYMDFGIRYDNSSFPWPMEGRETGLSLIYTDRMSEAILWRAQLKTGDRAGDSILPARKSYLEGWLQFIWGGGTHSHPLQ